MTVADNCGKAMHRRNPRPLANAVFWRKGTGSPQPIVLRQKASALSDRERQLVGNCSAPPQNPDHHTRLNRIKTRCDGSVRQGGVALLRERFGRADRQSLRAPGARRA